MGKCPKSVAGMGLCSGKAMLKTVIPTVKKRRKTHEN
jgi:hypothetical protein